MPNLAAMEIDLDIEENRHHRQRHADAGGWQLMSTLKPGGGQIEVFLLEPYGPDLTLVFDRPDDWRGPWIVRGTEVVPVAWRDVADDNEEGDEPDLTWFEDEDDAPFWTLCPYKTSRVCYSQAEGGCWADVGEPTELPECPPEIYRTSIEAYAASHRMRRRLDRLNREEGLRDLSSVIATYQYRAEVRRGLPTADEIPTYE